MSLYIYNLPVGDVNQVGHQKVSYFTVSSVKPMEYILAAYDVARERYPSLDPATFCGMGENPPVPFGVELAVKAMGGPDLHPEGWLDPHTFAEYVLWFINHGDVGLDLQLVVEEKAELPFAFGYGTHEPL